MTDTHYIPLPLRMLNTPLGRFRTVALIEGISYLVLLFIAMPLKYWGGIPEAVKYTGWAHGLLFVLYAILLLQVWIKYKWSFGKTAGVFIASLVPFAPFYVENKLKKEQQ